jgi:hypothetical protein
MPPEDQVPDACGDTGFVAPQHYLRGGRFDRTVSFTVTSELLIRRELEHWSPELF